uniref:Uncharacterized protein n=1 Tax=Dunaliella tertiolecta TaxID=3047 RepID=A0A7S3R541_DUNTE
MTTCNNSTIFEHCKCFCVAPQATPLQKPCSTTKQGYKQAGKKKQDKHRRANTLGAALVVHPPSHQLPLFPRDAHAPLHSASPACDSQHESLARLQTRMLTHPANLPAARCSNSKGHGA